ncbi:MAG: 2-phospho-L-lactate/phosphoenolpyruvate guanylyltransferase [Solirubrobacteraceae bacterium]|nr:2-phospho-L-lactate/phosphoenolpyruvate guanylyltransferase [Solirubrobacteraceae bacterium]
MPPPSVDSIATLVHTLAVLPVKSFGLAKQRLGDAVGAEQRRTLARAMAGDVLEALGRVKGLGGVIVVSAEGKRLGIEEGGAPAGAGRFARGVEVVHDPDEAGQSAAARRGIRAAVARGAQRVLLVPGDCPALDPEEVVALLAGAVPGVVIVPDRHGSGTNALLIAPPTAVEPAFGPGSFARHAALARAAGARVRVGRLPSLELDIDTPGDLAALRAALAARPGGAQRTRALLDGIAAAHAA